MSGFFSVTSLPRLYWFLNLLYYQILEATPLPLSSLEHISFFKSRTLKKQLGKSE